MQSDILTPFLNRDGGFDPAGWFQLVPEGKFPIRRKEGDKTVIYEQVVDATAITKIVAAFTNRQAADAAFKLLIDYEHFSHDIGKSSEAAAWVNRMEARADGVWAQAEWTPEGAAAIKNRRYRYLSPVWLPNQVERLGPQRVRPVEVNDAGLTNKPNLGDALQPFWNRADSLSGLPASENQNTNNAMKELIVLFGLAATATEADILGKATAYLNRAREADALQLKLDTLTTEHTAFKNRHESLLKTSVDRVLEENKALLTTESVEAWRNRLTGDFDGTLALLKGIKAPAAGGVKKAVHQPGTGAAHAATKEVAGAESEGSPFLNRVQELRTADPKLRADEAMLRVASEQPDLYEAYREGLTPAGR